MIKERSRYHFVYQSILTQIEQGELSPGDSLPTARQLCQQYGVGITTIRRVLRMLQASQAISCVQGRPALVVGTPGGHRPGSDGRFWAERGATLLDLCTCVSHLYPGLVLEGAARWRRRKGPVLALAEEAERAVRPVSQPIWMRSVVDRLLATLENPILDGLCLTLRHWASLLSMALTGDSCPETDIDMLRSVFYAVGQSIDMGETAKAAQLIKQFYRLNYDLLKRCLPRMTGGLSPQPGVVFTWSGNSGRLHLYMDLSLKLMELIADGTIPNGAFLPSLAQLTGQYHVSEITARKALAFLNELGVAHTINGKGTQVTLSACQRLDPPYHNPALREGVMNHLCTLQILALFCPEILAQAVAASPASARAEAARLLLDESFVQDDAKPVQWWLTFILRHTASPSLRAICGQLAQMLKWGHLLLFYRHTTDKVAHIRRLSRRVIERIAANDTQGAGSAAAAYYYYLFEAVRQSLPQEFAAGLPLLVYPG